MASLNNNEESKSEIRRSLIIPSRLDVHHGYSSIKSRLPHADLKMSSVMSSKWQNPKKYRNSRALSAVPSFLFSASSLMRATDMSYVV